MATRKDFVDYVAEQAGLGERLVVKQMFGEYALYVDGKVVALACDNSLFVKPTPATAGVAHALPHAPPYPGAKDHYRADALLDDPAVLRHLLVETAAALPPPKPKRPHAPKPKRAD